MAHLLQALAQHWHLSASQYWHLRILCALTLAPLLGILCVIIFNKRGESGTGARRSRRPMRIVTLRPNARRPLQTTVN